MRVRKQGEAIRRRLPKTQQSTDRIARSTAHVYRQSVRSIQSWSPSVGGPLSAAVPSTDRTATPQEDDVQRAFSSVLMVAVGAGDGLWASVAFRWFPPEHRRPVGDSATLRP